MAVFLPAKTPTAVTPYEWCPAIPEGDSIASFVLTPTGAVIDTEETVGDCVAFYLSGGTAAQTASIAASIVTNLGAELDETLYVPIVASAAQIAATARDIVGFALRKITGPRRSPSSVELDDALERLNAMVAAWRAGGADIGAAFPLVAGTVIYCPDWAVQALRYNLLIDVAALYGAEPTALEYEQARRGLQLVKHKNLSNTRTAEYY